jgi:hypothetical protein
MKILAPLVGAAGLAAVTWLTAGAADASTVHAGGRAAVNLGRAYLGRA